MGRQPVLPADGNMRRGIRQTLTAGWRWSLLYVVLAFGLGGVYLAWPGAVAGPGFPLDDGWIHQTYARNLALTGGWAYVPGQVSAGSTSPLWTALLAVGYGIGFPFMAWTMGLGMVSLAWAAWGAHRLAERLTPGQRWIGPAVGLLCVAEWHLVWAAVSGMETMLYVALALALTDVTIGCVADGERAAGWRWAGVGALAGLLVLTRPEGVILIGLLGLWGLGRIGRGELAWRTAVRGAATALAPFLLLLGPYLVFNWRLSGRAWPNTFYAKQAEYAVQLAWPIWTRLGRVLLPPLVGAQILLVPGLLVAAGGGLRRWADGMRRRSAGVAATAARAGWLPPAYAAAHLCLYALRLPVTYQHGRYLMPAIPFVIIAGVAGLLAVVRLHDPRAAKRIVSRAWVAALVVLTAAFVGVGAQAYQRDVEVIDSEMVAVARWLAENSEPDDLVAAHDIGAIGYYAERPILDLAGLISPEVIPLLGDWDAIAEYVLASEARYLVTAPGWPYEALTGRADVTLMFSADSRWTAAAGLNSSAVYRLPVSGR